MKKYKRRLLACLSVATLGCVQFFPVQQVFAQSVCAEGTTLNVIAHPDDDLFFINPKIKQDIDAGRCVETLVLTAGEGIREGAEYWQSREVGLGVAYAKMIGDTAIASTEDFIIANHTAKRYTFMNNDRVSLVFLRLPDGGNNRVNQGDSLRKLWHGEISALAPHTPDWQPYTKQELTDTLRVRMSMVQPDIIRTLDFSQDFASTDHRDHITTALFTQSAHQDYTLPHELIGFEGYGLDNLPDNVTGSDYTDKLQAYYEYDYYDYFQEHGARKTKCPDITDKLSCHDEMERWIPRNYVGAHAATTGHSFETMDGDVGSHASRNSDTGRTPAAVQFGSDLWIFYYDESTQDLRFAKSNRLTPGNWSFGTLDSRGDVGQTPAAIVHNNTLHVFYYDKTNTNLRHAWLSGGTGWQFNNLDGDQKSLAVRSGNVNTGFTPTVTVFNGGLQLFYFEPGTRDLRHAWSNATATSWSFETFDGAPATNGSHIGDVGYDPHAVVFKGMLHVFYYDDTTKDLRMSKTTPSWQFSVVDGDSVFDGRRDTALGLHPSAAVYGNTLQVVYYDQTNGDLRHAWYDGVTNWRFDNLDGDTAAIGKRSGDLGATPHITNDNGTLHVFAYDAGRKDLRHYWTSASQAWQAETLDGRGHDGIAGRVDGDVGESPIAIPFAQGMHVFYYDQSNTSLRHAAL